jgi:hypothetical protein
MTARQALALVRKHGVLLEAARGPVPSLVELIAGTTIRGSWWSHPKGREIFAATRAARDSDHVLVCRVVNGKITYVHRRAWSALVRLASRFPVQHLSRVREVHTSSGRHAIEEIAFPDWVPPDVRRAADTLSEDAAMKVVPFLR